VIHSTRFGRQYEQDRKAGHVSARPRRRVTLAAAAMSSATADNALPAADRRLPFLREAAVAGRGMKNELHCP